MTEEYEEEKIDWDLFESQYFKVSENPTDITLTKWGQVKREFQGKEQIGIKCIVIRVNGQPVSKELVTTSKRLISALRPHLESAEKENKKEVTVRAFKSGVGVNTQYKVKDVI